VQQIRLNSDEENQYTGSMNMHLAIKLHDHNYDVIKEVWVQFQSIFWTTDSCTFGLGIIWVR
jgi:hypothetical protein